MLKKRYYHYSLNPHHHDDHAYYLSPIAYLPFIKLVARLNARK